MGARSKADEVLAMVPSNQVGLDEYTARVCLDFSIGDLLRIRETATNARAYFVSNLVFSAIFERDMALIEILANRIDGTVPTSSERDTFANIMGDAIDDVLDMQSRMQVVIEPDDPVIIALAKAVFAIATLPTKGNPVLKRERQKAVEMVYGRTSGRRTEPVRPLIETKYVEPEWMKGLEDGSS